MTAHLAAYRALLARVQYRPGWTFRLDPTAKIEHIFTYTEPSLMLSVKAKVIDVDDPTYTKFIHVVMTSIIPDGPVSDSEFYELLDEVVYELEVHEQGEWFRVSGVKVHDPHKPTVEFPLRPL